MITQKEAIRNIFEELQNSVISLDDLYSFFNQMVIEYCATDDFCDSLDIEVKKDAIKVIGSILNQFRQLNGESTIS